MAIEARDGLDPVVFLVGVISDHSKQATEKDRKRLTGKRATNSTGCTRVLWEEVEEGRAPNVAFLIMQELQSGEDSLLSPNGIALILHFAFVNQAKLLQENGDMDGANKSKAIAEEMRRINESLF